MSCLIQYSLDGAYLTRT